MESVKGLIALYNLTDWWLTVFTSDERNYIKSVYDSSESIGGMFLGLTTGNYTAIQTTDTQGKFLWCLAGYFLGPKQRHIARRILIKAEEASRITDEILDLHFTYSAMIKAYYPDRKTDHVAFELAIKACEEQIAIAEKAAKAFVKEYPAQPLPSHLGYKQLAVIREKQRKYAEVIRLSQEALRQGWRGDWERRISNCQRKLDEQEEHAV